MRLFPEILWCAVLGAAMTCVVVGRSAAGQQAWVPAKIVFTGQGEVKSSDLLAVVGLTAGKQVTSAEIDVAMQHLVDTGLFSDMRYTVNSAALTFALTPAGKEQLLTAKYSNFVWWKDAELTELVHARMPLFTGKVPVTGTMKGEIENALAAIVQEKGVQASVTSIASADLGGGSAGGVMFSIAEPMVKVGQVQTGPVSAGAAEKVAAIKARYEGDEYNAYQTGPAIQSNLQDTYFDLGYLDATSDAPVRGEPKVGKAITVDLTTAVHEGGVYHVSEMAWPESPIVSKQGCAAASKLKVGDVASRIELLSAKASVERRFAAKGYVDAKLAVTSKKDEAAHQIAYSFGVVPGDQYTVGSVSAPGLNAEQKEQFEKAWKLAPGRVYDEDYVMEFLKTNSFMRSMAGYGVKLGKAADRKSKTVAITITFVGLGVRG